MKEDRTFSFFRSGSKDFTGSIDVVEKLCKVPKTPFEAVINYGKAITLLFSI